MKEKKQEQVCILSFKPTVCSNCEARFAWNHYSSLNWDRNMTEICQKCGTMHQLVPREIILKVSEHFGDMKKIATGDRLGRRRGDKYGNLGLQDF